MSVDPNWVAAGCAVTAVFGGFVAWVARKVWRKAGPLMRRLNEMLDDWFGEPSRPGVPERPGVMVRLQDNNERLSALEQIVRKELTTNGGSSVKDQLNKLTEGQS